MGLCNCFSHLSSSVIGQCPVVLGSAQLECTLYTKCTLCTAYTVQKVKLINPPYSVICGAEELGYHATIRVGDAYKLERFR